MIITLHAHTFRYSIPVLLVLVVLLQQCCVWILVNVYYCIQKLSCFVGCHELFGVLCFIDAQESLSCLIRCLLLRDRDVNHLAVTSTTMNKRKARLTSSWDWSFSNDTWLDSVEWHPSCTVYRAGKHRTMAPLSQTTD